MMLRRTLLGAFAAAALWATPATAQTWKCTTYVPNAQLPTYKGLEKLAVRIGEITGGKASVKCHVGGSLGIQAGDLGGATADGIVDITANAFITGYVPLTGIFSLPGLFATEAEVKKGVAVLEPQLTKAFAEKGLVYIGQYRYPRQVIFSTEPVKTLDDLRGKKMRVSSGEQAHFATTFGGVPVTIGTPDVATSLQRGAISVVMSAASGGARLWTDMLKYNLELGPNFTVSFVFMNKRRFDSLSPDEQAKLRTATAEIMDEVTSTMAAENADLVKQFAAKGMVVTAGTTDQETRLVESMKDYWPQWAAQRGPLAVESLEILRKTLGR